MDDERLLKELESAQTTTTTGNKDSKKLNWHVKASSDKGSFQWLVCDETEAILDCPYFLRGYWIGRIVDVIRLTAPEPQIIVTCQMTGRIDEIRFTDFDVIATTLTSLPDYTYDEPYTGGLYDIRKRQKPI